MAVDISIVVPVYRNAETLPELHRRLCVTLETPSRSFEIIFVNDACPAGSLDVLRKLAEVDSRVVVVPLEQNVGQQRAVLTGLARARGRWTVVMDADLQDPPEVIPLLLSALLENRAAAVFAARRGEFQSRSRQLGSRVYKGLLRWLVGIPRDVGLFVAMNRQMVERLLAFDAAEPFIIPMIGCTGLALATVPVERAARPVGRSGYSGWGRFKLGCRAIVQVFKWKWKARRICRCQPSGRPV